MPADLQEEYQELKATIDKARMVTQIRTALPDSYRTAFVVMMVLATLLAAGIGTLMARIITRRINALVHTARRVSDGHVDARVELRGADEMALLGDAFNTMLDDLEQTRGQIEYLQR